MCKNQLKWFNLGTRWNMEDETWWNLTNGKGGSVNPDLTKIDCQLFQVWRICRKTQTFWNMNKGSGCQCLNYVARNCKSPLVCTCNYKVKAPTVVIPIEGDMHLLMFLFSGIGYGDAGL